MVGGFFALLLGCPWSQVAPRGAPPPTGPVVRAPPGWLKGQTHLHSSGSGDSDTPPADVVRWYEDRAFDFIVFTDHERVTEFVGPTRGMLVFRGVELTQNAETCEPPPERGDACLLHVNALFVAPAQSIPWGPDVGARRLDAFTHALEVTRRLGGIAQLNHPNFQHAADAALVTELGRRGVVLLEIANESGAGDEGDATHPPTEALWDAATAAGVTMYGVASDDAHHYDDADRVRRRGGEAYVGDRGYVMVHAGRTEAEIRSALTRGDFYASTGVVLSRVEGVDGVLAVDSAGEMLRFELIGEGGLLGVEEGSGARFSLAEVPGGWARVVATDGGGKKAWTQPFRRTEPGP